ncbi:MAG: hypothetical protein KAV87_39715, partial [Desulfobacteraceae bacterium]|nr:hypothetical protein [Desulfobacteraceae bacterium]
VGKPARFSVYGEKQAGVLTDIRRNKIYNSSYSYWKEPYLMGKLCKTFSSISELEGLGVITMEFIKRYG